MCVCGGGNVAVSGEMGNVYMELVVKCVCVWMGECGSYWGEGKCTYGVSG